MKLISNEKQKIYQIMADLARVPAERINDEMRFVDGLFGGIGCRGVPDNRLHECLGLYSDWSQLILMVLDLEEAFEVEIMDEEAGDWETVGDVVTYFAEKRYHTNNEYTRLHFPKETT